MSRRSDIDLLQDLIEAAGRIMQYCAELDRPSFDQDTKTQDAVLRNIEILGEAAKSLSDRIKDRCDDVPWRNIARMRDRLVHAYFGVNWDIVWDVVMNDLPELAERLNQILTEEVAENPEPAD
jgi:uncharacterized protein with HEPN domain